MAFFNDPQMLATLFTGQNFVPAQSRKFAIDGLKPIEAFTADIRMNLRQWATANDAIYYKTDWYWYEFAIVEDRGAKFIAMRRVRNKSWEQCSDFANISSLESVVGKEWLVQQPQRSLRVPLFHTS